MLQRACLFVSELEGCDAVNALMAAFFTCMQYRVVILKGVLVCALID